MFSLKSLLDKVTSVQSDLSDKLSTSPGWERETPDFPEDVDLSTGKWSEHFTLILFHNFVKRSDLCAPSKRAEVSMSLLLSL